MSKSEESEYSRINLNDDADEIIKKIKRLKQTQTTIPDENKKT